MTSAQVRAAAVQFVNAVAPCDTVPTKLRGQLVEAITRLTVRALLTSSLEESRHV